MDNLRFFQGIVSSDEMATANRIKDLEHRNYHTPFTIEMLHYELKPRIRSATPLSWVRKGGTCYLTTL